MKKYVTAALFIFWVIVTGLFVAGLLLFKKPAAPAASGANQAGGGTVLNEAELIKHTSTDACWLLISGKIYDVSSYLTAHPGGANIIIPYCGREATGAFATRGGGRRNHSSYAYNLLSNYYIGDFEQISGSNLPPSATATSALINQAEGSQDSAAAVLPIGKNLTTTELSRHNSIVDCWLLISGKIYEVTNYLNSHPGGVGTIAPYCGVDGTAAFATKAGRGAHSSFAYNLLNDFYIGQIGSSKVSAPAAAVKPAAATQPEAPIVPPPPVPAKSVVSASLNLTAAELAKHNSINDCWLLISGKIYNVTAYLSSHPGGVSAITNYCGADGTSAFETKGGRGSNHSSFAWSLLANYYVGDLGQSVSQTQVMIAPVPANPTKPKRWEEEND